MRSIERLEHRLADRLGRRHCIAVGRGATGLWLAYDALKREGRDKVVIPATLCLSPVVVARLCGTEPIFCDVEPTSGNLSAVLLDELLASRNDVCAVLVAHLYGTPADIANIARICRKHGVPVIEDVAQAYGAEAHGHPLGAFGDIAILSFGHTKIIDVGDGGAILTDHDDLAARLHRAAADLPRRPPELPEWSADYRAAYYAIVSAAAKTGKLRHRLGELGTLFPGMYRYGIDDGVAGRINDALDGVERNIARRRALSELYSTRLAGLPIDPLASSHGAVPWRFNIIVAPALRDGLLGALRTNGFDASSWYPAVPPCFLADEDWKTNWPAAAAIEDSIVNLWVDGATTEDRVLACCGVIRSALEGTCGRRA